MNKRTFRFRKLMVKSIPNQKRNFKNQIPKAKANKSKTLTAETVGKITNTKS